ncbi:MAG: hypothetical protein GY910_16485 [bacterium]|nr:hypothetical protein [bacterium]
MGLLVGERIDACGAGPRARGGRRAIGALVAVLGLVSGPVGCGREEGAPGTYGARGTVEDVDVSRAQVLIDHADVPGLMQAMTMNFVVPDPEVLQALSPGQIIDFEIHFTGRSYEVSEFEVVGEASPEAGWRRLGDGLVLTRPAPDFELIDQAGNPLSLASLEDRALLFDFIYTECPGPCPIQTSKQVALQKRIPDGLRRHVHFVSISLDPVVDRPEILTRYARTRGADLSNWSFLTGGEEVVASLVTRWGVGSVRKDDGSIDHLLITFLVQGGRVLKRYMPDGGGDEKVLADLIALAEARARGSAGAP